MLAERKGEFLIGFEDSVGRFEMMREGQGPLCGKPQEARVMLIRVWKKRLRESERRCRDVV